MNKILKLLEEEDKVRIRRSNQLQRNNLLKRNQLQRNQLRRVLRK